MAVLSDRRTLDVIRRLASYAGTEVMLVAGQVDASGRLLPMPPGLTDAQRAVGIAEAGWLAVSSAILIACDPAGGRHQRSRRVWKAMTPETGAAAAIFMSHGLGATLSTQWRGEASSNRSERQEDARRLLRAHVPWAESDERDVSAAASLAGPPDFDPYAAYFEVASGALRRLVGDETASRLPGIASVQAGTWDEAAYVASAAWQSTLTARTSPYLALTDPEAVVGATAE